MPPKKKPQKKSTAEDGSDDEFIGYTAEDDVVEDKSDDDDVSIVDSDLDTNSVADEPRDDEEEPEEEEEEDNETENGISDKEDEDEDDIAGLHGKMSRLTDDDDDIDNLEEPDQIDEEDDEYYQKLRGQSRAIQEKYHPELTTHSIDEMRILSMVVRDKNGKITDTHHRTLPFLTKYEKARVLGERTQQLDRGAPTFLTDLDPKIIKSYIIASMELEQRKIPFIIQRPLPNGKCEFWPLKELEIL
jgi:DNA-directed RNA polymerase I, II, and III subunit RPABC2